jgi:quinol monooxygenase YgiN
MILKIEQGELAMYAQKTLIFAPIGTVAALRQLIAEKYLPEVRNRPGFMAAYLLEQTDDEDSVELIQFWDSHASIENFQRTGLLQASIQSIAIDIPGIRIQKQGYVIRVAVGSIPSVEMVASL